MGYGIGHRMFYNSTEYRIDRVGQGQGWSPTIWTNVHNINLTALKEFPGMLTINPKNTIKTYRQCYVLMDDTCLGTSELNTWNEKKLDDTIEELNLPKSKASCVTKQLQILGQKYERYHTMSGGRDNLSKIFFYFNKPVRRKLKYKFNTIKNTKKRKNISEPRIL